MPLSIVSQDIHRDAIENVSHHSRCKCTSDGWRRSSVCATPPLRWILVLHSFVYTSTPSYTLLLLPLFTVGSLWLYCCFTHFIVDASLTGLYAIVYMLTINTYLLLTYIAFTFIVPLKIKLSFSSFAMLTLISLSYALIPVSYTHLTLPTKRIV